MLSYDAWNCTEVSYYTPPRLPSDTSATIVTNLGLTNNIQPSLLSQQPRNFLTNSQGEITGNTHHILEKALEEIGGASAILFLVAKVYEDSGQRNKEVSQSKALQLLFAFINHSAYIGRDYMSMSGHQLLTKVLTSSRSSVGYHTLKVKSAFQVLTNQISRCWELSL